MTSPVDDSEEFILEVLHQKVLHEINEHLTKRPKVNQQESPDKVLNLVRNFLLLSGILALVKKLVCYFPHSDNSPFFSGAFVKASISGR